MYEIWEQLFSHNQVLTSHQKYVARKQVTRKGNIVFIFLLALQLLAVNMLLLCMFMIVPPLPKYVQSAQSAHHNNTIVGLSEKEPVMETPNSAPWHIKYKEEDIWNL